MRKNDPTGYSMSRSGRAIEAVKFVEDISDYIVERDGAIRGEEVML